MVIRLLNRQHVPHSRCSKHVARGQTGRLYGEDGTPNAEQYPRRFDLGFFSQMIKGDADHRGATKKFGDAADLENKHRALDTAEAEKLIHRLPPDERRVRRYHSEAW